MTADSMFLAEVKLTPDRVKEVKKAMKWKLTARDKKRIISMLEQQLTLYPVFIRPENNAAIQRKALSKLQKDVARLSATLDEIETQGFFRDIGRLHKILLKRGKSDNKAVYKEPLPSIDESLATLSEAISLGLDDLKSSAGRPVDTDYLFATINIIRYFSENFKEIKISAAENSQFWIFMTAVYTHVFRVKKFDMRSRIESALKALNKDAAD